MNKLLQPVIWIVDISASMVGKHLKIVKRLFSNYTGLILSNTNSDIEYMTSVLTFNTDCRWCNEAGLVSVNTINIGDYNYIAEGMTNVGIALSDLK